MKQNHFERYEQKYILNSNQKKALLKYIQKQCTEDNFPHSRITSVYYDTPQFSLIRASMDADNFKEKIRLRQYYSDGKASELYLEMKRKVDGVVYKRRRCLKTEKSTLNQQLDEEFNYAFDFYKNLKPTILISYHRDAYIAQDDGNFRLTLDSDIKARFNQLDNLRNHEGDEVLDPALTLLEVKSTFGYPQWFLEYLQKHRVYKQSFSKYATAYQNTFLESRQ